MLLRGMGHNTYGEIAWPNDLLYMFPISILAIVSLCIGLSILSPIEIGIAANPFATPHEILPEWFLYPTFEILRVVPNKLLGIIMVAILPIGLAFIPFLESYNRFQNPIRRPIALTTFFISTILTINLGIAATQSL